MTTYIAFLRSINVGGRTVKMERLRELFSELGLTNVRSYIQSGNVFFETDRPDREALTRELETHLGAALGYTVPVMLRTVPEVEAALALDPFKGIEATPDVRFCLVFTVGPVPENLDLPVTTPKGEFTLLAATGREAFVMYRIMNGRSGNPAAFIEKQFGVAATSRFLATAVKILAAAKAN